MDIQTLTTFFMWCTIINGGLFVYWAAWHRSAENTLGMCCSLVVCCLI